MTDDRPDLERAAMRRLLRFVEDQGGMATSYYDPAYLDRRVSARVRRTDADGVREYLRQLRNDPEEQAALADALSINVTSFFRDPEVWGRLREVLREVSDERFRPRLWSAPCSDGREPYSYAMLALDDDGIDADTLSIYGSDIDEAALETARRGVYDTSHVEDLAEQLSVIEDYTRYVDRDGDRFRVREPVRERVRFDRHDLVRDEPRRPFDVVSCRNLFIYIASEYKESVFETVTASLRTGGYLVIGKTETVPGSHREGYEPVDRELRIFRRVD